MQGCPKPSARENADCGAQKNEGLSVAGKQVRGACRLVSPSPTAPPGTWGDSEPSSVLGTSRRGGRGSVTQAGGGQACLRVWILSRRRKEGGQGRLVMLTTAQDPSQAASPPLPWTRFSGGCTSGRLSVTPGPSLPKLGLSQQFQVLSQLGRVQGACGPAGPAVGEGVATPCPPTPSPLPLPHPEVSAAVGSGAEWPRPSLLYLWSRLGPRIFFSLTDIHHIPFK